VQLSVSGPLNLDLGARFGFQHKISYSIKIKTHLLVISNLYLDNIDFWVNYWLNSLF